MKNSSTTFQLTIGNTYADKVATLQQIKDAQVAALVTQPSITELAKENEDISMFIEMYLEAHSQLKNLELPQFSDSKMQ